MTGLEPAASGATDPKKRVSRQTTLAITAFGYATLMGTEGVALYMRKPWAPWFTIIATYVSNSVMCLRHDAMSNERGQDAKFTT